MEKPISTSPAPVRLCVLCHQPVTGPMLRFFSDARKSTCLNYWLHGPPTTPTLF